MTDYMALSIGEDAPNSVTVVIEIARNKATKYDRQSGRCILITEVHQNVVVETNQRIQCDILKLVKESTLKRLWIQRLMTPA